jgi:membrane protein, antimicrobial resistance system
MQEENSLNEANLEKEDNADDFQPPPPPEQIPPPEPPQMSEAATLGGIFFEPGNTFEDLRRKPRFIMALLIVTLLTTAYGFVLNYKVGEENSKRFYAEQIDKSPQGQGLTAEQKQGAIALNLKIASIVRYVMPLLIIITIAICALFYWVGAKAFGGTGNYLHALSVWVYSSLPVTVVAMIANFIVLALKSADDIDIATSQRGVIHANPAFLLDGKAMPVLATLVGTLDVFMIWGWILAAIGLRITNKISSTSAWAITIIFALVGITLRVIGAYFSGNPV